jgi:hypothetical protein
MEGRYFQVRSGFLFLILQMVFMHSLPLNLTELGVMLCGQPPMSEIVVGRGLIGDVAG